MKKTKENILVLNYEMMEEKFLEIVSNYYPVIDGEDDFFFDTQKKLVSELVKIVKNFYE